MRPRLDCAPANARRLAPSQTDRRPPIEHFGQDGAVDAHVGSRFADLQIQGRQDVVPQSDAVVGGEHGAHSHLSVVILVVHKDGISVFKRKRKTRIAVDADRPVTGKVALDQVPAAEY